MVASEYEKGCGGGPPAAPTNGSLDLDRMYIPGTSNWLTELIDSTKNVYGNLCIDLSESATYRTIRSEDEEKL